MITMNKGAVDGKSKSSSRSNETASRTKGKGYVTEITPNDVLFGRGAPTFRHPGNVRFREIVLSRKAEYLATTKHEPKQRIAQEIIDEITCNGKGKFLREVKTIAEARTYGIPLGTQAWIIVDVDDINAKVKQALREGEGSTVGLGMAYSSIYDTSSTSLQFPAEKNLLSSFLPTTNEIDPEIHDQRHQAAVDVSQLQSSNENNHYPNTNFASFLSQSMDQIMSSLINSSATTSNLATNNTHQSAIHNDPAISNLTTSQQQQHVEFLRNQLNYLVKKLHTQLQELQIPTNQIPILLELLQGNIKQPAQAQATACTQAVNLASQTQVQNHQPSLQCFGLSSRFLDQTNVSDISPQNNEHESNQNSLQPPKAIQECTLVQSVDRISSAENDAQEGTLASSETPKPQDGNETEAWAQLSHNLLDILRNNGATESQLREFLLALAPVNSTLHNGSTPTSMIASSSAGQQIQRCIDDTEGAFLSAPCSLFDLTSSVESSNSERLGATNPTTIDTSDSHSVVSEYGRKRIRDPNDSECLDG